MVLQGGGRISHGDVNNELARGFSSTLYLNDGQPRALAGRFGGTIQLGNFYSKVAPDYWWCANYGLSTGGWTAIKGGLNFSFSNVSSANGSSGAYFNGSNSFGITQGTPELNVLYAVMRLDSVDLNAQRTLMGGTQNGIHELYFTNTFNNWFNVEAFTFGNSYGTLGGTVGSDIIIDFVNQYGSRQYLNGSTGGTTHTVYFGGYPYRFRWQGGYQIYLGRRGIGSFGAFYIKELALFTSNPGLGTVFAFRDQMRSRWP